MKRILLSGALWMGMVGTLLADGAMLNGISPRSIGRGGTNIAHSDNGAILFDNPAGAVNIEGNGMLDLGVDALQTDFRFSNSRNAVTSDSALMPLPQLAIIKKTPDEQWAYGLGIFVPSGFSELYHLDGPGWLTGEQRYRSFAMQGKILPALSYRVTDRLTVGGTLGVGVSHVELEGPYYLQTPPLDGILTKMSCGESGAALLWSVGVQYELTDQTQIGASFQSAGKYMLHGRTNIEIAGMGECGYDSVMRINWPQTLGVGVRHELCPHRVLSADVLWTSWSTAFDYLGLYLNNPSTPGFPTYYEECPHYWSDTVSERLGYERTFDNGHIFRCGYVHCNNPIPASTMSPYVQAILEHSISVGYGWKTYRDWQIDLSYMYSFSPHVNVGTSGIVGGDFNNSMNYVQAHIFAANLIKQY